MDLKEYLKMLESGKRLTRNTSKPIEDKARKKEEIKSDSGAPRKVEAAEKVKS
ncbi:MAG: hypothetical protein IPK55_11945 [Streptococcus sp.]|nr:hypothetical protein [Streptococcus sp.]